MDKWAAWYQGWPVIKAEGPGRGWWGPPKGTHGPGSQGGTGIGGHIGQVPEGPDTTTEKVNEWLMEGLSDDSWQGYSEALDEAAQKLADKTGYSTEDARVFIEQWAEMKHEDQHYLSYHQTASELFNAPVSDFIQDKMGKARDLGISFPEDKQRKLFQAMYDTTQEELGKLGFGPNDTIRLVRGVKLPKSEVEGWKEGDVISPIGNGLESWTTNTGLAKAYGYAAGIGGKVGVTIEMDVPRSMIIGTPKTGFGMANQQEYVILDNIEGSLARIVDMEE